MPQSRFACIEPCLQGAFTCERGSAGGLECEPGRGLQLAARVVIVARDRIRGVAVQVCAKPVTPHVHQLCMRAPVRGEFDQVVSVRAFLAIFAEDRPARVERIANAFDETGARQHRGGCAEQGAKRRCAIGQAFMRRVPRARALQIVLAQALPVGGVGVGGPVRERVPATT